MESDADLVQACRRGDETAWERLVSRYQRLLYAIPRRAGLTEDKSAEVFQEVFLTLFQKLDDITEPDRLHAWLVTTARRKTLRLIASEGSRLKRVSAIEEDRGDDGFADIPDRAPLQDEVIIQLEKQHLARLALASLDERCRKILTLLFYEATPPSYDEIAKALGISVGSIGPTRARCLEKMLRLLD
ncbi:MAG TPA: sigma-70 family RNA polymerase sigma factor [Pyrinomonadaceae bacterium]|nr:sigma-70 family RNA polymerase sigma factor [Pyrinomonadaceae bacterium]